MKYLAIVFVLLAASFTYSAPVPKRAVKPIPEFRFDGKFKLMWGGSEWVMYLDEKSSYTQSSLPSGHSPWHGNFNWDAKTRTLQVKERTSDDESIRWMSWTVILDKDLKGSAKVNEREYSNVEVSFSKCD